MEQTIEIPDITLAEKIVEGLVAQTEGNTQQVVNTDVQHVVNTVEAEMPTTQFTDKVVDIPVAAQRQISMVLTVQKSIEISQLQYCDEVIDVPVVSVVPVPQVRVVKKTVEDPQFEIVEKTVENPETQTMVVLVPQMQVVEKTTVIPQFRVADKVVDVPVVLVVQAPLVQVMAKTVQIPQLPFIEKIAVIPEIWTVPGTRTSERANGDSVRQAFMKGLITDFTDMEQCVFDGMFEHVEASMQQPHRSQEQQTVQGEKG